MLLLPIPVADVHLKVFGGGRSSVKIITYNSTGKVLDALEVDLTTTYQDLPTLKGSALTTGAVSATIEVGSNLAIISGCANGTTDPPATNSGTTIRKGDVVVVGDGAITANTQTTGETAGDVDAGTDTVLNGNYQLITAASPNASRIGVIVANTGTTDIVVRFRKVGVAAPSGAVSGLNVSLAPGVIHTYPFKSTVEIYGGSVLGAGNVRVVELLP